MRRYDLSAEPPAPAPARLLFCLACRRVSDSSQWGSQSIDWAADWETLPAGAAKYYHASAFHCPTCTPGCCPYAGCDNTIWRTVDWHTLRWHYPDLPEQPEHGVVYSGVSIVVME